LASGLLAGKITAQTKFPEDDHRNFNRQGQAFDVGETFSGVNLETGLKAVEELKTIVPQGATLAQTALRWILMFDSVTCAIPGAKRPEQVDENLRAAALPPLDTETMRQVRAIYDRLVRPEVHTRY
jgi:aryl-alcohol dehydrogenase-like predicted oxidoreductase